jgi:hypothetical protein
MVWAIGFDLAKSPPAPIATEALKRIAELYEIEAEIRGKSANERRVLRQEKTRPLVRPIAVNRKNALFAGSDEGAENWALLASLIETCKLHGVNPEAYLSAVLTNSSITGQKPARRTDALGLGRPTPLIVTPRVKQARQPPAILAETLRLQSNEATSQLSGTFQARAMRFLILFAAQQVRAALKARRQGQDGSEELCRILHRWNYMP